MKTINANHFITKTFVFAAILSCLVLVGSAFAANPIRNLKNNTFEGECCFSFNESVTYSEPATISAVVVTFSTDYRINVADEYHVGLSVNGGPCETEAYGSQTIADTPPLDGEWNSGAFQWVILPSDGLLVKGLNTFELCGGGKSSSSDSITIGQNTLAVQK
jgi:hypothetical protein